MAESQLLLRIPARMSGERTTDGKGRLGARYIPWVTAEEFAKDANAAIDDIIRRINEAKKAGVISGITTKGDVVTDKPFTHDGFGAVNKGQERGKLTRARFLHFLAKGTTLAHQQDMQKKMAKDVGDPEKMKAKKGSAPDSEEDY